MVNYGVNYKMEFPLPTLHTWTEFQVRLALKNTSLPHLHSCHISTAPG